MPVAAAGLSLCQRLRPPWCLVVVVASWLAFLVQYGIIYSYNVLFLAFMEEFQSSVTLTGWIGSVSIGTCLLIAPFVDVFVERFGCRAVSIVGIITASGSILVTSFLTNILSVFFVYGILGGVGGGLLTIGAYDVILLYFPEKNCVRAMAFSLSGTSLGLLSFTPFMAFIIKKFGWRVLLRILGPLLFAVGIPCVMTFVEPSKKSGDTSKKSDDTSRDVHDKLRHNGDFLNNTLSSEKSKIVANHSQKHMALTNGTRSIDTNYVNGTVVDVTPKSACKLYHQIAPLDVNHYKGGNSNGQVVAPEELFNVADTGDQMHSGKPKSDHKMTRKLLISLTFPELWLISIATVLNGMGDCFYLVNMLNYMISVGFPKHVGVNVVSTMGFSNLVGKIFMSLVGDYVPFPRVFLLVISSVISVGIMFVIMFNRNQIVMFCIAVVIGGVTVTTNNTITYSLPSEFFGPERALETSGIVLFAYGLGYVLGSVIGQSVDRTGSYSDAIWAFIVMYTISGLCMLLAPVYQRLFAPHRFVTFDLYRKKRDERRKCASPALKSGVSEIGLKSRCVVCERVTSV